MIAHLGIVNANTKVADKNHKIKINPSQEGSASIMEERHQINLKKVFFAETAEEFLQEAFPPKWGSLVARILGL
jgi:hypothetical protein